MLNREFLENLTPVEIQLVSTENPNVRHPAAGIGAEAEWQ